MGISVLQKVRSLLDEHGYREPLPPEGTPLARHLIEDVILKSEQLKDAAASLDEYKEKCEALNVSIEPYKEENGRLLTKLNQLHMENLKLREQNGKLAKDKENSTRQLEVEKKDLEFVVEELKRRICAVEEESSKKSDKILQLQEKNLKAVVVTPGGTKKPIAYQRQRMEISSHLHNMTTNTNHCPTCGCGNESIRSKNKDLYIADLLRMSERKLTSLQRDAETHKQNAIHWEEACSELKKKIENRDREISRLQMLLEGGRPISAVIEDNKLMTLHSQLHQLKLQNELLTKTNVQLDLKLKSVLGDSHEAMNMAMAMEDANKDLTAELQNVTSTNRILKKDCTNTKETLSMKLAKNKELLKDYEGDLVEQHSLYHVTRDERDELKREISQLSRIHACLKEDLSHLKEETCHLSDANARLKEERRRLQEILARGQGERKGMADRMNTLTVQLQELEMERISLQSEVTTLRSNIATLEKEKTELETSQNFFKKEGEKVAEQKREVELEKAFFRGETVKLQSAKEQLESEKAYFQEKVKELEEQKASAEEAREYFNVDANKYKEKLETSQQQEHRLKNRISELDDEKDTIMRERDHYNEQVVQLLDIMKVKPSSTTSQVSKSKLKLEEELPKVIYERDVLMQELSFYKTQLRSLQTQLQRLKKKQDEDRDQLSSCSVESDRRERSTTSRTKGTKDDSEDLETLKSERNFLRDQMEHFQRLYNEAKMKLMQWKGISETKQPPGVRSRGSPVSPLTVEAVSIGKDTPDLRLARHELRVCEQEKEFFREQYERLKSSLSKPLSPSATESADVESLVREKNILRDERDFYKKQLNELSSKISESAIAPSAAASGARKPDVGNLLAEKRALALSKAQLEAQLLNLRDDMSDLERENNELNAVKKELSKSVENMQNATVQKLPASMQNFIGEIRKSREAALDEVERLKQERETLRTKLKSLAAQQIKDRSTAQEDITALRMEKDETESLTVDLEQRLKAQSSLIASLQNQIKAMQEALQQAQSEIGFTSKQSEQFKVLLERKAGEADNQGQELELRSNQLGNALSKIHDMESEVANLQQDVARLEAEGKVLRGNLGKIDNDKDALTTELDSKAEFIATIKAELKKRIAEIAGLEAQAAHMEQRIESCEMTISTEQRKVAEETQRGNRFQQDLAVATEQKEAAIREIRNLQKQVIELTEDVKELHAELERTKGCRENFKRKAQEYCRTLEHLSTAITSRDKEQDDLVQQYLSLNETISSLKSLNATLEESATNQTMEITKMEDIIKSFKEEREYLMSQINEALTRNEDLEKKCHHLEEEKFNLERDLLTNKDLTQKLEMRRSELENEARRLGHSLEKILEEKRNLEHQLESATAQLSSERNALRSLEEVISEKRKAEFLSDSAIKQLEVERNQLQRKVSELNAELESETSEVKRLRSRTSSVELDLERAKRQLTNEQYERERAEQELRRVRKYSSMQGALAALQEVDKQVAGKNVPKRPDTAPVYSYSPSSNGAVGLPQRESPIYAYSPTYSNGVTRQPLDAVVSPCAAGSKILYSSFGSLYKAHTDSPDVAAGGEEINSWRLGSCDKKKKLVMEDGRTTILDETGPERRSFGEYSSLAVSNGFPSTTNGATQISNLHTYTTSSFTTPVISYTQVRSSQSVHHSDDASYQPSRITTSSVAERPFQTVSPSTCRISSPPEYNHPFPASKSSPTFPLSLVSSKSSSTSTPPLEAYKPSSLSHSSPQLQASSLSSASSHIGTKSQNVSNSNSQSIALSHSSSKSTSNNYSHLTSHSHSPFHSAPHISGGYQISSLTSMRTGSLPLTPLPSSQPRPLTQSLQNIQSFIKPSVIAPKTFYSYIPDIPARHKVQSDNGKVGTTTVSSPEAQPSINSVLETHSQHSDGS